MSLGRFGQLKLALEPFEPRVFANVMLQLDRDYVHQLDIKKLDIARLERAADG